VLVESVFFTRFDRSQLYYKASWGFQQDPRGSNNNLAGKQEVVQIVASPRHICVRLIRDIHTLGVMSSWAAWVQLQWALH
jgi:hypothetical protein